MLNDLGLQQEGLESFMAGDINFNPDTLQPLPIGDGEALPGALHLRGVTSQHRAQEERRGHQSGACPGKRYPTYIAAEAFHPIVIQSRRRHTQDASE